MGWQAYRSQRQANPCQGPSQFCHLQALSRDRVVSTFDRPTVGALGEESIWPLSADAYFQHHGPRVKRKAYSNPSPAYFGQNLTGLYLLDRGEYTGK
jgi:hypothetical protein